MESRTYTDEDVSNLTDLSRAAEQAMNELSRIRFDEGLAVAFRDTHHDLWNAADEVARALALAEDYLWEVQATADEMIEEAEEQDEEDEDD